MIDSIRIQTTGRGLHDITEHICSQLQAISIPDGLCTLFLQHTSASLLIQENYDDSARVDLENWLNRLVPEGDPLYTHTLEGPDDMPAHIKAALTATQISIPFRQRKLMLGTWQGIYLWEHRHEPGTRNIVVHLAD